MKKFLFSISICLVSIMLGGAVPVMKSNPKPVYIPPSPTPSPVINTVQVQEPIVENYFDFSEIENHIPILQKAFEKEDANVNTVKDVIYNRKKIFKLNVREAMTSTVELPESETIKDIILGDESSFIAEQLDNNLFIIFPQKINRDTSLTIITENKTIYPFYLRSISFEDDTLPDLLVRVQNKSIKLETSEANNNSKINKKIKKIDNIKEDFLEDVEINPADMNWNFKMKGNKEIAPYRVWSDGVFTYLDFKGEKPKTGVLAYKVTDKVDTPVNVRWVKDVLVIETVGRITLRSGDRYTCIYPN